MATNPTLPVVATGDLITASHMNNVRANIDRLDTSKANRAGDTLTGTLTGPQINATTGMQVGGDPTATAAGTSMYSTGAMITRVEGPSTLTTPNIAVWRAGAPASDVGGVLVSFGRAASESAAVVAIGSITIATGGGAVLYNTTSDGRLKTVTGVVDGDDAAAKVAAMQPVRFLWTAAPEAGEQIGFVAQDLHTVAPEAVTVGTGEPDDDDGFTPWQVDLSRLIPTLVAAIQALTDRVAQLEATP